MIKKHQQNCLKKLPLEYSDLKDFIIDLSDFVKLDILGKGSFGTVWKAQHLSNGWIVAIKEFSVTSNKSENSSSSSLANDEHPNSFSENEFFSEVRILSKCTNNPFFIQLVGFSIHNTYAIVTSFVPCGSVWDILHPKNAITLDEQQNNDQKYQNNNQSDQQSLNDTQKNIIALGISYAMKYLHSQNIIHLDIKSPNILLDEKILPKIADFGLSQFYDPNSESNKDDLTISSEKVGPPSCNTQKGTPMWMAPEQICGLKCGPESDVYSFGVILYELYTGKEPYQGLNHVQIFYKVVRSNERPKLPETESPLSQLISSCWDSDPKKRPTFSEIFELFQSGKVKFPLSKESCVRETMRIIDKHERAVHEAMRKEAGILNQAVALRHTYSQLVAGKGSDASTTESKKYFASYAARLAGQGRVSELDVLVASIPAVDLNEAGEDGVTPIKAAIANDQLVSVQFLVRLHRALLPGKETNSSRSARLNIKNEQTGPNNSNLNLNKTNSNSSINNTSNSNLNLNKTNSNSSINNTSNSNLNLNKTNSNSSINNTSNSNLNLNKTNSNSSINNSSNSNLSKTSSNSSINNNSNSSIKISNTNISADGSNSNIGLNKTNSNSSITDNSNSNTHKVVNDRSLMIGLKNPIQPVSNHSLQNSNSVKYNGHITSPPLFDINSRDADGNTPFLLAVIMFRPRIVAYLAQVRTVDVNAQNGHGLSALHIAARLDFGHDCERRRLVMIKALSFASNLRVDLRDREGKLAFERNPSLLDEFLKRQTENREMRK